MSASLKGKTIAFAGPFALNQGKREAVAKALMAGATVSPSVNKNVDIVFKGDAKLSNPSAAEISARNQGAKVLSASSFLNFVKAGGAERMKSVARAMSAVASKPAAPIAVRQQKLRAQVTTSRATKSEKKALVSALNKKVANAAKKAASLRKGTKSVPEVSLSAIYADKTDSEIEKMEKEAATFGPMPWQKGSKFQKKQAKVVDRKKAKLNAKKSTKKTAAPTPVAAVEAPAAPVTTEAAPAESATITCNHDSNTITFTPSKGMTVKFSGDFEDFCKMAAELSGTSGSINHPMAATATPATIEATAVTEAPAVPEKTEEKAAEATAETKEASATDSDEVMKEVKKLAKKSAAAPIPVKKASGIDRKKFAAIKKVAGRARKVVTSKSMKSANPDQVSLKKKTISFTGTFFQLKRIGLQALATKAGASVSTGLKDIDLVVIGADAAHKKKQAKQLGVPFISEQAFIASCKK